MRVVDLLIHRHGWRARFFFPVTRYDLQRIILELEDAGCPLQTMRRVAANIQRGKLDTGFTYSNNAEGRSVVVLGKASSPAEFQNSLQHEVRHLVDDVAKARWICGTGERVGYLTGDINLELFPYVSDLLCTCYGRFLRNK